MTSRKKAQGFINALELVSWICQPRLANRILQKFKQKQWSLNGKKSILQHVLYQHAARLSDIIQMGGVLQTCKQWVSQCGCIAVPGSTDQIDTGRQAPPGMFRIGILQIEVSNRKFYGIGVCVQPHPSFITLSRYFMEGAILRVFAFNFSTQTEAVQFPIKSYNNSFAFDVIEENIGKAQLFGDHKMFMKLKLKPMFPQINQRQIFNNPTLLPNRRLVKDCRGFLIGIPDYKKLEVLKQSFVLRHISQLRLNYRAALIFLQRQGCTMLYGIYDNLNKIGHEDYYLTNFGKNSSTSLIQRSNHQLVQTYSNQAAIWGSLQRQQIYANNKLPYCSIGLLQNLPSSIQGTATILFDKKQKKYKYLITCAHNFIHCKKLGNKYYVCDYRYHDEYSFQLPRTEIIEQPDRYMATINQKKISIKQVYIPDQYTTQLDFIRQAGLSQPSQCGDALERSRTFDIAIIQLREQISVDKGFRVSLFQKPFHPQRCKDIQITGFPATSSYNIIFRKQYTSKASEYTGITSPIVELRRSSNQTNRTIKHKLSTLPGNSGSPIYQNAGNQNSIYLFGVHTNGRLEDDSTDAQFLRLQNNLENPTFGIGQVSFSQYNVGTYLYSQNIYKWFLSLPGIHTVTDNYAKLISHIAVLQLGDPNGEYGIGFLIDLKHIAFSSSYSTINRVIIKKYSETEREDNILAFNLQQKDRFHFITNYQLDPTSLSGLKGLQISAIQAQQHFEKTIHASKLVASQQTAIGQSLGLKVSLEKKDSNQLRLFFEPFEAKKIFGPLTPGLYFVLDFRSNVLIWAAK